MLRRTPLKRSKPLARGGPLKRTSSLKRTAIKRSRPKPTDDPIHLSIIRSLPCCVPTCGTRRGVVPHHNTHGAGMSRKTSDREAMPLCGRCHRAFHDARGYFANFTHDDRTRWQAEMVERFRVLADFPVLLMVRPTHVGRWEVQGAYATEREAEKAFTSGIVIVRGVVWAGWWGPREEAAKLLADPEYLPSKGAA